MVSCVKFKYGEVIFKHRGAEVQFRSEYSEAAVEAYRREVDREIEAAKPGWRLDSVSIWEGGKFWYWIVNEKGYECVFKENG